MMLNPLMSAVEWRIRLREAIAKSGLSDRAISIAAGMSSGYLHGILKKGKDPTVSSLFAICDVLGVSISEILNGTEISEQSKLISRLLRDLPEDQQAVFAEFAKTFLRSRG